MNHKHCLIPLIILLMVISACNKKEFLPPQVGEQIPYTDSSYQELDEVLKASPYQLFYQAWLRSAMKNRLTAQRNQHFTFLVPTDEALSAAGWTAQKINTTSTTSLDTLLMPYVLQEDISPEKLGGKTTSYLVPSFLTYTDIHYANDSSYVLQHALALKDNKLLVNGKAVGTTKPTVADLGHIWPLDQLLNFTLKSAWQVLKEDGRFSLYTGITEYSDSVYNALFFKANGYLPENSSSQSFVAKTYYRNTPRQQGMLVYTNETGQHYIDHPNTWFIPSDAAFHQAGFQTLQDLIRYNETHGFPDTLYMSPYIRGYSGNNNDFQGAFYALHGFFATDSILDYHSYWGMRHHQLPDWEAGDQSATFPTNGYVYWQGRAGLLIFSNDLAQLLHPDLQIASYTYKWHYSIIDTYNHYCPLTAVDAQTIQLSDTPDSQVGISEPDIYTLNGVIHVVDHLFQPKKQ